MAVRHGRKKYKPSQNDLDLAYQMRKHGKTDKDIARALGIGIDTWRKNKSIFETYFSDLDEMQDRENLKKKGGRVKQMGKRKVSDRWRKLTHLTRKKLIKCLENDMTVEEAAEFIGISARTIYLWCKEYPAFKHEMDTARERSLMEVKENLVKAGRGGYVTEVVEKHYYNDKGKLVTKEVTKKRIYVKPSVDAIKFLLVNRAKWTHDSSGGGVNNKGKILSAVENMVNVNEEDIKEFD